MAGLNAENAPVTLLARLLPFAPAPLLAGVLLVADAAPGATARASATVLEPVVVRSWLGVPVSVQELLSAHHAPAGPATGDLVPALPQVGAPPPQPLRPVQLIAAAVESRTPFGIDIMQDASVLARGPAAAVSAEPLAHDNSPLVITVAFN